MVRWLRNFWYQDLPNEMQRKMLANITSNRPSLDNFVRRSVKNWLGNLSASQDADIEFRKLINHDAVLKRASVRMNRARNTPLGWYAGYPMHNG